MPLAKLRPDRTATIDRPKSVSMKSSAEEKESTSGRAITMATESTSAPMTPPRSELAKDAERARAASPFLARGKPSSTVAWLALEPGIPIMTEVKVSPVGMTATMPISIPSAEVVSMP